MKAERLFRVLALVDEDLIEEVPAAFSSTPAKRSHWRSVLAAAACLTVVCVLSFSLLMIRSGGSKSESATAGDAACNDGGSGIASDVEPLSVEGTSFMSYAGPVFPLTLAEETEGITAERITTWDFTPGSYQDGSPRQWGSTVTDSYVVVNHTTGDIVAMAAYPVAASFEDLAEHPPTVTVDGEETSWTLHAGSYAGGFRNAGVDDGSTWNLDEPSSWTDYKALLEDGAYQEEAFSETSLPTDTVTVYSFTDFKAPPGNQNVEQVFSCVYDRNDTTVLSYGFNSLWCDDPDAPGWYQYGYNANRAIRQEDSPKYLIILGEDVTDTALRSLVKGNDNEVLEDVFCTVKRCETTLGAVLEELCADYMAEFDTDLYTSPFTLLSLDQFTQSVQQQLTQHGVLAGEAMKDRYTDGRLDELIQETLYFDRVLYLTVSIAIPAGGSVTVTVEQWKEPSFDYGCSGSDHVGLQGYDFVTHLGSNLDFTEQKAALSNTDTLEIIGQNFGFDLDAGITEVTLDPDQEHYYLEIRPKL